MSCRRARHDIIMEILKIAKGGIQKTNMMYKARLSHAQLEKYLKALKERGFVSQGDGVWTTTDEGAKVIEACELCHSLVEEIP